MIFAVETFCASMISLLVNQDRASFEEKATGVSQQVSDDMLIACTVICFPLRSAETGYSCILGTEQSSHPQTIEDWQECIATKTIDDKFLDF